MLSRTTTSIVTFAHSFVLAGYSDELPAGDYEVIAEDEVLECLSLIAYRRTATHFLIKAHKGARRTELRPINRFDLELALLQDVASSNKLKK